MKILYDHQIFSWQKFGGVSRYFYELMSGFNSTKDMEFDLGLESSFNHYLLNDPGLVRKFGITAAMEAKQFLPGINFRGKSKLFALYRERLANLAQLNRKQTIAKLQQGDFDVFHPTYYDPYFLEYIGDKPFVMTVFDMIHEMFPEYFTADDPTILFKKQVLAKAAKIITISNTVKNDLIEIYNIDPNRVEVVYLASSLSKAVADSKLVLPSKYVLFVGERARYKNFSFMMRVLAGIMQENKELVVACVGGGSFSHGEKSYFKFLGIPEGKVQFFDANDASLATLYQNAQALIYPSLAEGFGIPVVEAFGFGCPVVTSDIPVLREIGVDAARYFSPKSFNGLKAAITDVIYDESIKAQMKHKGVERAKDFSYAKTAEQTAKVYQSVI